MNTTTPAKHSFRRALFTTGVLLTAAGILVLLFVVVAVVERFGVGAVSDLKNNLVPLVVRATGGALLTGLGFAIMTLSAGLNGAGELSDVEGACNDLEPWSWRDDRNIHETLTNHVPAPPAPRHVVSEHRHGELCCRSCHAVNNRNAKFCDQCGTQLASVIAV